MRSINILAVPNQALSVVINGSWWEINIKQAQNCMFADISRDGEVMVQGQRILPNQPVIPYRYLSVYGNFVITTNDDEYPYWERFNIDQELFYLEPSEVGIND